MDNSVHISDIKEVRIATICIYTFILSYIYITLNSIIVSALWTTNDKIYFYIERLRLLIMFARIF